MRARLTLILATALLGAALGYYLAGTRPSPPPPSSAAPSVLIPRQPDREFRLYFAFLAQQPVPPTAALPFIAFAVNQRPDETYRIDVSRLEPKWVASQIRLYDNRGAEVPRRRAPAPSPPAMRMEYFVYQDICGSLGSLDLAQWPLEPGRTYRVRLALDFPWPQQSIAGRWEGTLLAPPLTLRIQ